MGHTVLEDSVVQHTEHTGCDHILIVLSRIQLNTDTCLYLSTQVNTSKHKSIFNAPGVILTKTIYVFDISLLPLPW